MAGGGAPCEDDCFNYLQKDSKKLVKLKEFFQSHYNRGDYILTLAISGLLLMAILIILSPYRRHSRNRFLIGAIWASQALTFSVISNTLGLMQSPPYNNMIYAIWAMLCLLIHGIFSSRLYRIQDKQQEKMQAFQEAILLYLASWSMYLHNSGGMLQAPLLSILGVAFLKFIFRLIEKCFDYSPSCRHCELRRRVKLVADFMSFEHEFSKGCPSSMEGYKYLVKEAENISELIETKESCIKNQEMIDQRAVTVEMIWQCDSIFLGSSEEKKLKDKCLSFAMFRLLLMRFAGFPPREEHRFKNWLLVRDGLLSKPTKHERAFQVVEDELSFLYDYFYTQYPLVFSDGTFFAARTAIYALLELAQFVAGLWIIFVLATSSEFSINYCLWTSIQDRCEDQIWSDFADYECNRVSAGINYFGTCIFIVLYVALQIFQLLNIVFSDWAKVWLLCKYIKSRRWYWEWLLRFVCCWRRFVCCWKPIPSKPWRRKIGQYYLLDCYNYSPTLYFLISAFVDIPKRGQKSHDSKELDPRVKSVVLDSLMENGRQLTNGSSSLRRNGIDSLSWACRLTSTTKSILVWHVATSLCNMEWKYRMASEGNESGEIKRKREVAECLSGYCAYLVAFVPALLPGPTYAKEVIFDEAILEARGIFGSCRDRRSVYERLRVLGEEVDERLRVLGKEVGVVRLGAKLGMQLLSDVGDEAQRWKVLVDFWVEMTLFLASSSSQTAHAESLKNGGEFITLLWAFLTHVGGGCPADDENIDSVPGAENEKQPLDPPQSTDERRNPAETV